MFELRMPEKFGSELSQGCDGCAGCGTEEGRQITSLIEFLRCSAHLMHSIGMVTSTGKLAKVGFFDEAHDGFLSPRHWLRARTQVAE